MSFRLDGVIAAASELPDDVAERVFGRIKFLAHLKTYQDSLPQDGRIEKDQIGASSDIRVATYPTVTGEKIVLRLFQNGEIRGLHELALPDSARHELESFLKSPSGLLLLTGPAGSGKTTTIYACLRYLAGLGGRHIITVEDPVEQVLHGVMQTEVNEARGLSFAKASRHLLRQDPQVLVIGEIRDEETAQIAVRAALTGHLMISTLHAGSCKGVFERLAVLCPDVYALSSAIELVINQRLIRRLCPGCRVAGCAACLNTGYRGRVPVIEWLRLDETVRKQIRERGLVTARPEHSLETAARQLVEQEITSTAEYERILSR